MTIKKYIFVAVALISTAVLLLSNTRSKPDWGFFGHQRINRMAVFTLPPEMVGFYKKHIEYITAHAVDPDKRRYAVKLEAPRHFIDADHWGVAPFPDLPRNWTDALARYTDIFVVNEKNDTMQLLGDKVVRTGKRDLVLRGKYIKRIFKKDSITINKFTYKKFFRDNVEPLYYEDKSEINPDTLAKLFTSEGIKPKWKAAFSKDQFSLFGIVPYHLEYMKRRLTTAFRERDAAKILRLSAEIGHYIGDAHVPLHTTENYNGQKTNQVGIHGFWESRIPELFADKDYDYFVGKAEYITDFHGFVWKTVMDSHALLDSVLLTEKDMVAHFPTDKQMCYEDRLGQNVLVQCKEFARAWQDRMGGMVESRMRTAIISVASTWYSAWIDAGSPDLTNIDDTKLMEQERAEQEALDKETKGNDQMLGRPE